MSPMKSGDPLKYRAIAGDVYDASLLSAHREPGLVNVRVFCQPGRTDDFMDLFAVTFSAEPTRKRACTWPAGGSK